MKFPFFASPDASRVDSVSESVRSPLLRRKKSAPTLGAQRRHEIDPFPEELKVSFAAQKSKRRSIARFFQSSEDGDGSRKGQHRASKMFRPVTSHGNTVRESKIKPLDIDDERIERIMGKPNEAKAPAGNILVQQKLRAGARSRTRAEVPPNRKHLTPDEVRHMFRGAPCFEVLRTETGYRPHVYLPSEHSEVEANPANGVTQHHGDATEPGAGVTEVSGKHIDLGATSFELFLQLALADSAQEAKHLLDYDESTGLSLAQFAQALDWPNYQLVEGSLQPMDDSVSERPTSEVPSLYLTPVQSIESASYANEGEESATSRQADGDGPKEMALIRRDTAQSTTMHLQSRSEPATPKDVGESATTRSRSSDVVLPEGVVSELLMSRLIALTPDARQLMGHQPAPRHAFLYRGRGFWSTKTVAGRVMAASKRARASSGWISTSHMPGAQDQANIALVSQAPPGSKALARIFQSDAVSKESAHIGSGDVVYNLDFTTPVDGLPVLGNEVRFTGCSLDTAGETPAPRVLICSFVSPLNSKLSKLDLSLTYDVHYVSSYPCHPVLTVTANQHPDARPTDQSLFLPFAQSPDGFNPPSDSEAEHRQKPTAPQRQQQQPHQLSQQRSQNGAPYPEQAPPTDLSLLEMLEGKTPTPPPAHPLHNSHRFEVIPVATLLSSPRDDSPPPPPPPAQDISGGSDKPGVVVLDCRGTEDLQLLARAWCAHVGEHALISTVGRTCLGCSVREARALDVGVVIRIS